MPENNFKGEKYPEDILADMQMYIEQVNSQIFADNPLYLKDFISFTDKGNKKNVKKFAEKFKFNTDNPKHIGKDIKGLYVLAEEKNGKISIVNVGISRTIMRRFYQHTTGKKHNESTLGFYMALNNHKENNDGKEYEGKRDAFPYENYRPSIMEYVRNLRFAIVPIDNNFELYMAEVYLACHYKSLWNTFKTH